MSRAMQMSVKEFMVNSPEKEPLGVLLLAHGPGKGMASPFLERIARGCVASGLRVVRFNFPFMEEMLRTGKQKEPDSGAVLRRCYSNVVTHCIEREKVPAERIFVGGKAMGARTAAMIADAHRVRGVICMDYPFYPPRKPARLRFRVLKQIRTPTLVCQGELDANGMRRRIEKLEMSKAVRIHWLPDGDSNFATPPTSNRSVESNITSAIAAINDFISTQLGKPPPVGKSKPPS